MQSCAIKIYTLSIVLLYVVWTVWFCVVFWQTPCTVSDRPDALYSFHIDHSNTIVRHIGSRC